MKKAVIALTLALCLLGSACAQSSIEVYAGDIKVYVNGVLQELRDANGNPVEPFLYNGNVYLPLPAVADALGVPYEWKGSRMSAYLGKEAGEAAYLLDVCPAYEETGVTFHTPQNGSSFAMAGQRYTNGLTFTGGSLSSETAQALFNLNGQYKTLRFVLGHVDGRQMKDQLLRIYLDGRLAAEYTVRAEGLPQEIELDLDHALSMKIDGMAFKTAYGMAEITVE